MTDFKEGDKVKVEFEGVVDFVQGPYTNIIFKDTVYNGDGTLILERFSAPHEFLTLLEPAKPELAVGQVYRFLLCEIKIAEIGEIVVGAENLTTGKNIALLKSDFDDRMKLITEGENG